MSNPTDTARAAAQPCDASTTTRTLDLTTADASLTGLAAGVYELMHSGTGFAVVAFAATTSMPPSTGAAEVACVPVPPGGVVTLVVAAGATLHARILAGTATLYVVRKVIA